MGRLLALILFCIMSYGVFWPDAAAAQDDEDVVKQRISQILQEQTTAALRALQNDNTTFEDAVISSNPERLIANFCRETLGRALSGNCSALGSSADVDPLRLSRAIGFADGSWSPPDNDTPDAQAIAAQVAADSAQLRTAVAQASRKDGVTIAMSGPAVMLAVAPSKATFQDIFPDGIGTGADAVEAAVMRILTTPGLNAQDTGRLMEELKTKLPQGQRITSPTAPPDLSGLVGDPMVCDDLALPADLRPLEDRLITLPRALHGADDLLGVMIADLGPQMVLLTRYSQAQARIYLPMHGDIAQNQDVGLVLMFADGPSQIKRRCNMQTYALAPPAVTARAFPTMLDEMVTLMEQTNALAQTLNTNAPFPVEFITDQRKSLKELHTDAYTMGSAVDKFVLDAVATSLLRLGISPGEANAGLEELMASRDVQPTFDEGRYRPNPVWPLPQSSHSLIHKAEHHSDIIDLPIPEADLLQDQCPVDMDDLQRMIRLQHHGAYADTLEGKILLGGSGALASMSAGLFGTMGHAKLGEISSRAVGASSAMYGIYLGFLKGMLPSTMAAIEVDVSNQVLYEDQPDARVRVDKATLITTSEGFDLSKAAIDAVIGLIGLKGGPSGGFSASADDLLDVNAIMKSAYGTKVFDEGANLLKNQSISFAIALFGEAGKTAAGVLDGELVNYIYTNSTGGTQPISLPPQTCKIDMLDEKWAWITLEDRDLAFEYESFGTYRGMRDGTAKLKVELHPNGLEFVGDNLPVSLTTLTIPPLQPMRLDSPGAVVPGEVFTVTGGMANSANPATELVWELDQTGVVSSDISTDTTQLTVQTTRSASDFPITGKIGVTGTFLPNSEASERRSSFAVQAGGLWLVPTRNCISPGGEVQIFVIDSRTGERVPPRELVFHTDTDGIDIDGDGLLRSTKEDRNVTIYARGVGANGYRGQVTIRADCTCGVDYFDPDIVVPANSSGPGGVTGILGGENGNILSLGNVTSFLQDFPSTPDIFAIDGTMSVSISGDVNLSYNRPFALDLIALQAEGPYGPACSYLTGGFSPVYLGTQLLMATPGGLMPVATEDEMRANTYRANMGFSLEDFGGPDDFGMLLPSGGMNVIVRELETDKLALEISGRIEGFKYIAFEKGLREDIAVQIRAEFVSNR